MWKEHSAGIVPSGSPITCGVPGMFICAELEIPPILLESINTELLSQ